MARSIILNRIQSTEMSLNIAVAISNFVVHLFITATKAGGQYRQVNKSWGYRDPILSVLTMLDTAPTT